MKVRLVGGPFGGQKKELSNALSYRNEIVMRGPKKMTRKQKYQQMMNTQGPFQHVGHTVAGFPISAASYAPFPTVEARYRLAMRPHHNGRHVINAPCQHPDGSLFYEYVEGSKTEL